MNPIFGFNKGLDYSYLYQTKSVKMSSVEKDIFFPKFNLGKSSNLSQLFSSQYDRKKVIEGIRPSEFPKAKFKSLSNSKSFSKALENTAATLIKADYTDKKGSLKSVKSFITAYNNLVESSENIESSSILRREVFMTGRTLTYASHLKKLGIQIEKNNTLSINEVKFEMAEPMEIEEVLKGRLGFAERIGRQASIISNIAENKMNSINKTYNRNGKFYSYGYATRIYEAV